MRRTAQLLPILFFALAAGLTYWLLQANLPGETAPPPRPKAHVPDYFADNFSITMLDNTGTTQYRLNALDMMHFEDDQTTAVTKPSVRIFTTGQPNVTAASLRGVINGDGSIVDLYDQANVVRDAGPADPRMRADSEHFRLFVNDDVVATEKPVKLQRGLSVSTADGMTYNNVTRRLVLLGRARGMIAASEPVGTSR